MAETAMIPVWANTTEYQITDAVVHITDHLVGEQFDAITEIIFGCCKRGRKENRSTSDHYVFEFPNQFSADPCPNDLFKLLAYLIKQNVPHHIELTWHPKERKPHVRRATNPQRRPERR